VPDPRQQPSGAQPSGARGRTPEERVADHAAIERLVEQLLPALTAKLAGTGLGEIELREGDWRVRLRRPAGGVNLERRASDRPSRAQPGHAGHGHAPAALEGHRAARSGGHSTNGTGPAPAVAVGPAGSGDAGDGGRRRGDGEHRTAATSPAVGVFRLREEVRPGTRVRAGDPLGAVDMLGIPQEVVSPADGVVGASLVESGEAVEYGQDLVVIELAPTPAGGA
jgi:biotin carboxyl carrier protein